MHDLQRHLEKLEATVHQSSDSPSNKCAVAAPRLQAGDAVLSMAANHKVIVCMALIGSSGFVFEPAGHVQTRHVQTGMSRHMDGKASFAMLRNSRLLATGCSQLCQDKSARLGLCACVVCPVTSAACSGQMETAFASAKD